MQQETIKHVLIWSGWLRLCHWTISFGVLLQIASAWGIVNDYVHADFWLDWHLIIGQVILVALAGRCILFFTTGTGNWRSLVDFTSQLQAMVDTARFYLSFARLPLPNWYAHNPLWKPAYLFIYIILGACLVTGLMHDSGTPLLGHTPRSLHSTLATIITVFTLAHIVTTMLHDWKGKGAFISSMLSGYRYFHYDNRENDGSNRAGNTTEVHIDVDSFRKK